MPTDQKPVLVKKQGLTQTELAEIQLLADTCNTYEGLDLKLNRDMLEKREQDQTNDFLYYEDGALVGFLPLFSFNSTDAEISGMVHPDYRRRGIFTALFCEARAECQCRGFSKILLIVESASSTGQAFAHSLGTSYGFAEYAMALEEPRMPVRLEERLQFRSATPDDLSLLVHISARAFDCPENEVIRYSAERLGQADHGFYVGELDGVVIGKIDVDVSRGYIHGFGVWQGFVPGTAIWERKA